MGAGRRSVAPGTVRLFEREADTERCYGDQDEPDEPVDDLLHRGEVVLGDVGLRDAVDGALDVLGALIDADQEIAVGEPYFGRWGFGLGHVAPPLVAFLDFLGVAMIQVDSEARLGELLRHLLLRAIGELEGEREK